MSAPHLNHLAQLIGNDSHAATFQSLGQYRQALLKEIAQASSAPEQKPIVFAIHAEGQQVDETCELALLDEASQYEPECVTALYTHPNAEIERLREERDSFQRVGIKAMGQLADAQALLKRTHRDLDACQKVIWLAGVGSRGYGFDPAYCDDAQARLAEIDAFLSAAQQGDQP